MQECLEGGQGQLRKVVEELKIRQEGFERGHEQSRIGADGSSRKAIRDGGLWKFLTFRLIYPLSNQS